MLIIRPIIFVLLIVFFHGHLLGQSKQELYQKALDYRKGGDLAKSTEMLEQMLQMKDSITERNKVAIYNMFGMIYDDAGRYDSAIYYYKRSIDLFILNFGEDFSVLSTIYSNLAVSYSMTGDKEKALEYYNIALIKVDGSSLTKIEKDYEKARLLLNSGVAYLELEEYLIAIEYLKKSLEIKLRNNFEHTENIYINLARAYERTGDIKNAEINYLKCIRAWEKGVDININFLPASAYKDYAILLVKTGRIDKALVYYEKSLYTHWYYYGSRHPYTSSNYLALSGYYSQRKERQQTLITLQQAIITDTRKFKNFNLSALPEKTDVISEPQMIKNLMKKCEACLDFYEISDNKTDKISLLKNCVNSAGFALELIDELKRGYLSKSSKLIKIQDEKTFCFYAAKASLKLFELTRDNSLVRQAFAFVQQSKASLLSEEISNHRAITGILPDSVRQKLNKTDIDIYSLKKLLFDENQQTQPDHDKIKNLTASLFKLDVQREKYMEALKKEYPEYGALISKSEIVPIDILQQNLKTGQTILEYALSPMKENKTGELMVFIINKHSLHYHYSVLDFDLKSQIRAYLKDILQNRNEGDITNYNRLCKTQFEFYNTLIAPMEKFLKGNELFIIPDEEMAFLSFDTFQKSFKIENQINYAGIPYLIYSYCFSYAYSSSLLFSPKTNRLNTHVYAFAPEYQQEEKQNLRNNFGKLENTKKEIESVFKWFKGESFIGQRANEDFFKEVSNKEGIFHFALHAKAEKSNPDFSFLAVNQSDSTREDGFFYNYEIAMNSMKASMVVLSGCNTGDGVISSGEGILSLSRNFTLAGAGSVVHSLWEVQDETGVMIMDKFYEYLSLGNPKNIALQQAKLFYIHHASPTMVNPYYWAGYIQTGDPGKLTQPGCWNKYFVFIIIAIFLTIGALTYKKLRRSKR